MVKPRPSKRDEKSRVMAPYDRREFSRRLKFLLKIVLPSATSKEFFLVALHTSFLLLRTILSMYVATLDGQVVKTIVERNLVAWLRAMFVWFAVGVPACYTNAMIKFLENKLAIAFRTRLTDYLYTRYMRHQTYYRITNLDGRMPNPDQTLTEDVSRFSQQLAHLYSQLSKPFLDVVLYTAQLIYIGTTRNGRFSALLPFLMASTIIWGTARILRLAAPPFAKLVSEQTQLEGELRFVHSRLLTNAEEVAFYGGEKIEEGVLKSAYRKLVRHMNSMYTSTIPYTSLEGYLMKYAWGGTGLAMIALPAFFDEIITATHKKHETASTTMGSSLRRGGIAAMAVYLGAIRRAVAAGLAGRSDWLASAVSDAAGTAMATAVGTGAASVAESAAPSEAPPKVQVDASTIGTRTRDFVITKKLLLDGADAVERIMLAMKELRELDGRMFRLKHLIDVFDDCSQGKYIKTAPTRGATSRVVSYDTTQRGEVLTGPPDAPIELVDVPIVSPTGEVLVEALTLSVPPGRHVLITGPNGAGKSSLFRILGGLWPVVGGTLSKPPDASMFYVPQRPYLVIGSLRDQVIYPHTIEDMHRVGHSDTYLEEIMNMVSLRYIVDREGGWDAVHEWKDVLSGGEKQRVAMARLFYHRPRYAVLDECTSAVSVDVEGAIYRKAQELGITLLTVTHRPTLWKFHSHLLQFDGCGGCRLSALNATARTTMREEKERLEQELTGITSKRTRLRELCGLLGEDVPVLADDAAAARECTGSRREPPSSPSSMGPASPVTAEPDTPGRRK
eukprot:TRINITY_DN2331_c0_g1_i1.p1 TRINITY_DN2331_c0_g1~~TRINITY_DN2331_c0_g1_i1.p1  ORF type:complete len:787 (+),score=183.31 TRINITY_DN2331_c0_g1_i1:76-2436(+)